MIEDPATPAYVQHRCMATLATLLRQSAKRKAVKAAAAAERASARDEATPKPHWNVLPDNGRSGPVMPPRPAPMAGYENGIPVNLNQ
jgi:hypothetical protein